ncbi:MAG TPA: hypothetical protein VFE82_03520 [Ramlibacter sp.]|jgi:hypothetical protein|uniref:hypothetical protein n=1 Tax=Ramlibacter sp. TaxID=1917967 RepID=UPI002D655886|nr:hypothetical protein [Ramlibacter sp.]HZY17521.1 hypothetical protein [Ramlibacter sp.]
MRIFYSEDGDPMLLDRKVGLHALALELRAFLDGPLRSAKFNAELTGDPAPYSEFLPGLRVHKAMSGPLALEIMGERWLELTAMPEDLERLYSKLAGAGDTGHTHFHAGPLSLILEADDSWPGFDEG